MRAIKVLVVIGCLLMMLAGCEGPRPEKIDRLSMLSGKKEGDRVEITGWVEEILGDDELGYELVLSETPSNYPHANVGLKDGQKPPQKERYVCLRAKIMWRQDSDGAISYRMVDGEVIECY